MSTKKDRHKISLREIEIIKEVCNGLSNPQIANLFHIETSTVRGHLSNIYQKLNIEGGTNQKRIKLVTMYMNKIF